MPFPAAGSWSVRVTRPQLLWLGVAVALLALCLPLVPLVMATTRPIAAIAATLPGPRLPSGLPPGLEAVATYVRQVACDPRGRRGGAAFGRLLTSTYRGTTAGLTRACGADGGTGSSEHYDGRAVDWMLPGTMSRRHAQADAFLAWLLAKDAKGRPYAMARRLGIMYIIWDKKIFGLYRADEGWRPYRCSGVTACHQDHVHFSLTWEGALGRTSFWSKKVATPDHGPCRVAGLNWAAPYRTERARPCPAVPRVTAPAGASATRAGLVRYSGAEVGPGSTGPVVTAVQRALRVGADGSFGRTTRSAVIAFQRGHGISPTGTVGARTWRALLSAG